MQSVPFLIHFLTQSQNCLKFWNVCTNILDESVAKIRLRIFFQNAIGSIFLAFVNKFLYVLKYHSFRFFTHFGPRKPSNSLHTEMLTLFWVKHFLWGYCCLQYKPYNLRSIYIIASYHYL